MKGLLLPSLVPKPRNVPLRLVLVVPFVIQIVAAVGLTGWLSLRNDQQAINDLSSQLQREVSDRIEQQLTDYLSAPSTLSRLNADYFQQGILNPQDLEQVGQLFWNQVRRYNVGYISLGTQSGEYVAAGHYYPDGRVTIEDVSPKRYHNTDCYLYNVDERGKRSELAQIFHNYNFKQEAWYSDTIRAGKPIWSRIYQWDGEPQILSITASAPIYDANQNLIGVVGVDQRLSQISEFLRHLNIGDSGRIFIVEPNGQIVASSSSELPYRVVNNQAQRLRAIESHDPLIRETANHLTQQFPGWNAIRSGEQLEFDYNNERKFVQVNRWQDAWGLDWTVVVVVPEADFMATIHASTRNTILLCLVALMVAVGVGLLTSRWIINPILRINSASTAIADGNLNQRIHGSISVAELDNMARSFNRMAQQLQESFDQVKIALHESEDRFTRVFLTSPDAISISAMSGGMLLEINESWVQLFGFPYHEAINRTLQELGIWQTPTDYTNLAQTIQTDGIVRNLELTVHTKSGDTKTILISAEAVELDGQTCMLMISRDITDRQQVLVNLQQSETQLRERTYQLEEALDQLRKAQAQLIQTEKMSSLGQLVAGIAHEINNPVNFIQGNLRPAQQHVQDLLLLLDLYQAHVKNPPAEIAELIDQIDVEFVRDDLLKLVSSMRTGTARIREIVLSLRNFSRLDEAEIKAVDVHEGIENTLVILRHRLKIQPNQPGVQIIREYGNLPLIECYAGSLNQVFLNILNNSLDAFEEFNETRSYEEIAAYPNQIKIWTQIKYGQCIQIHIADNGPGIPEEVRRRMFDPFFTTKTVGKGTGMGLAISYQIVAERHKGNLYCLSTPGHGAEFIIEIPVSQAIAA
ncbi:MAG TPA: ATP-binding protein [Crinalium sp.]